MKNKKVRLKIFHYKFLPENCKAKMNFSIPRILPNSRKGLSAVITTLILIALTISAIAIVWVTVSNLLTGKLNVAESCMNIFNKVEINELYTCYDGSNFQFSINIGDINIDEVIVLISGEGKTESYTLNNTEHTIANLANYPFTDFGTGLIKLPEKNSGMTYISNEFSSTPDSVKIMPVIDGNQCEVSDSLLEIYPC